MTDIEIFNMLYEIEPESVVQKKKIHKMMRILLKKDFYGGVGESEVFLDKLSYEEVIDKTSKEIYEKYTYWCKQNKMKPVAKNIFGNAVMEFFNVESRVIRVDGKCTRVYKSIY